MTVSHADSSPRRLTGYVTAVLAVLSCPCHIPVFALLLAGTAAGAFVSEHAGLAVGLMSVVFVFSLIAALKLLNPPAGNRETAADDCGRCVRDATEHEPRDLPRLYRDVS